MIISFTFLFIGLGYLCYKSKDDIYEMNDKAPSEREDYSGIEDLFI